MCLILIFLFSVYVCAAKRKIGLYSLMLKKVFKKLLLNPCTKGNEIF